MQGWHGNDGHGSRRYEHVALLVEFAERWGSYDDWWGGAGW